MSMISFYPTIWRLQDLKNQLASTQRMYRRLWGIPWNSKWFTVISLIRSYIVVREMITMWKVGTEVT